MKTGHNASASLLSILLPFVAFPLPFSLRLFQILPFCSPPRGPGSRATLLFRDPVSAAFLFSSLSILLCAPAPRPSSSFFIPLAAPQPPSCIPTCHAFSVPLVTALNRLSRSRVFISPFCAVRTSLSLRVPTTGSGSPRIHGEIDRRNRSGVYARKWQESWARNGLNRLRTKLSTMEDENEKGRVKGTVVRNGRNIGTHKAILKTREPSSWILCWIDSL